MTQIPEKYLIAIEASIEASKAILDVYNSEMGIQIKADGSPVTIADLRASKIISDHLSKTNIPIMGEELVKADFSTRSNWTENWCVDPLDGTKMFILRNDEFAVNIGHVVNGRPVFGLIADPVQSKIIIGGAETGVFTFSFDQWDQPEEWTLIKAKKTSNNPVIVACSRDFLPKHDTVINEIIKKYGPLNYLKKGSALKFFDLAEGKADLYLRFGPTMEWDIAAGQAIIEALGGQVWELQTTHSLNYNKQSLFNPPFIVKTKAVL